MKSRILTILTVVLLATLKPAQAGLFKQIKEIVGTSLSAVKVDSPAAKRLGLDLNGNRLSVISAVPFYGRVYVYDEEVALISPGESIEGVVGQKLLFLKWEPLNPQIPVLVKFYFDKDAIADGRHLGFAAKIFSFQSQNPKSQTWTIRLSDIRSVDGNRLKSGQAVYPLMKANSWTLEMDYPRESWNATAVVQVANNTYFSLNIALNGKFRNEIKPGEIYFLRGQEILESNGQEANFQFTFTSEGFIMGTAERSFRIPGRGVQAFQFILGPSDIRR